MEISHRTMFWDMLIGAIMYPLGMYGAHIIYGEQITNSHITIKATIIMISIAICAMMVLKPAVYMFAPLTEEAIETIQKGTRKLERTKDGQKRDKILTEIILAIMFLITIVVTIITTMIMVY